MKKELIQILRDILEPEEKILALWLGGSDATARTDHLSDIDLVMISPDPEFVFKRIEEELGSSISRRYVVTDGPYPQRFYVLTGTPETFYLDIVIFTELKPDYYREYFNVRRHGIPHILFDRKGILSEAARNPKSETPELNPLNEMGRFEIIFRTFLKESLRNHYTDAFSFYFRLVQILNKILRARHTPERHDFGLRYTYSDFPKEETLFLERMLKVTTLKQMQMNAKLMYDKVTHELGVLR